MICDSGGSGSIFVLRILVGDTTLLVLKVCAIHQDCCWFFLVTSLILHLDNRGQQPPSAFLVHTNLGRVRKKSMIILPFSRVGDAEDCAAVTE